VGQDGKIKGFNDLVFINGAGSGVDDGKEMGKEGVHGATILSA
jgi:hypothetical protein